MGRKAIGTLMLLATLSVIGVIVTQLLWLQVAALNQQEQAALNQEQASQLEKQFNDRVVMALTDVTEQILSITQDPTDLYDAVKQVRPNYFAVTINDTVHPYLLEAMLRKEFSRRNIQEDFEYGVYDCFTDSIVYGNYVSVDSVNTDTVPHSELFKLDKDGHYFGVFFPNREVSYWKEDTSRWTWIFPAIVTLIVFSFFAYSVWVILKQRKLSEMKNDFIGNMTHELKTPISTIALSSEVISDTNIINEPDRLREYARIIGSENERLRIQVERVLQLSTLEKGNLKIKHERVDLDMIGNDLLDLFRLPAKERNVHVELIANDGPHIVIGDKIHLTNAVANLLDNALKYGPDNATIEIRLNSANGNVSVSIHDQGIGIAKAELDTIFERFYRVHTGNVHNVKGFGLGLHYVKQIAKEHCGKVTVQSELGRGSVFTLTLPLAKQEQLERTPTA